MLRKNLEIEKSKQISTLPDSEITKTLEEHYKEKLNKLTEENEKLKKRYESYIHCNALTYLRGDYCFIRFCLFLSGLQPISIREIRIKKRFRPSDIQDGVFK